MGLEALASANWNGQNGAPGKLQLEMGELIFNGEFRLQIPLAAIQSVEINGGWLEVRSPEGKASFELGPAAAKWVRSILHPPTIADRRQARGAVRWLEVAQRIEMRFYEGPLIVIHGSNSLRDVGCSFRV